jgi:hypothetical protein
LGSNGVELSLGVVDPLALWEVLPEQSVGVLVASSLQGLLGSQK